MKNEFILDYQTHISKERGESPLEGLCRRFLIFDFVLEKKFIFQMVKLIDPNPVHFCDNRTVLYGTVQYRGAQEV